MALPPAQRKPSSRSTYFQRWATALLQSGKPLVTTTIEPTQPLPPEWQKLASDAFDQHANRTVELEFSGRFFSITFSPVDEHSYVNVYGFEITERKIAENYLLDHNNILENLVAGKPFQEILDGLSKRVDLNKIACEVIEDLETRILDTQGKVTHDYLPTVDADPFQMQQLLQNLIENALKYHKPDTPPVVHLTSQPNENESWDISV